MSVLQNCLIQSTTNDLYQAPFPYFDVCAIEEERERLIYTDCSWRERQSPVEEGRPLGEQGCHSVMHNKHFLETEPLE